jgi:hypothetical protein
LHCHNEIQQTLKNVSQCHFGQVNWWLIFSVHSSSFPFNKERLSSSLTKVLLYCWRWERSNWWQCLKIIWNFFICTLKLYGPNFYVPYKFHCLCLYAFETDCSIRNSYFNLTLQKSDLLPWKSLNFNSIFYCFSL